MNHRLSIHEVVDTATVEHTAFTSSGTEFHYIDYVFTLTDGSIFTVTAFDAEEDKRTYYDIARQEKEDLEKTVSPTARAAIINSATAKRQAMKAANPFLDAIITGGGFEIASETVMFEALEQMVQDPAFKIPEASRTKVGIAITQIRDFIRLAQDPSLRDSRNFADAKRQRKADIEALIAELLEGDLIVKEANRAVFQSILDYYSRDTYRAVS